MTLNNFVEGLISSNTQTSSTLSELSVLNVFQPAVRVQRSPALNVYPTSQLLLPIWKMTCPFPLFFHFLKVSRKLFLTSCTTKSTYQDSIKFLIRKCLSIAYWLLTTLTPLTYVGLIWIIKKGFSDLKEAAKLTALSISSLAEPRSPFAAKCQTMVFSY